MVGTMISSQFQTKAAKMIGTTEKYPPLMTVPRGIGRSAVRALWLLLEVVVRVSGLVFCAPGPRSGAADQSGALSALAANGLGRFLLWVAVVGFAGLALWQVTEAVTGSSETPDRIKAVAKAVVYAALAVTALTFARGGSSSSTKQTTDFTATAASEPGVYEVRVVFPEAGRYRYWVTDPATGRRYEFPVVTIGEPVAATPVVQPKDPVRVAADGGSFPVWPVAAGAAAGLALVGLALLYARRGPRSAARAAQ